MKKILFVILCLSFISCSNLYKANRAYDRGDYVQNVELTFKYFDEKPENFEELKEKKKTEINNKFSNIFEYYKKLKNSEDLVDRNNANIELFKIYIVSDNSEYSREFQAERDFLASNNIKDIFNLALKTNKELFSQYSGKNGDHNYALKVINHTLNMENSIDEVMQGKTNLDTNKMKGYRNLKKEVANYRANGDNNEALKVIEEYTSNMDNSTNEAMQAKTNLDRNKIELYKNFKMEIAKHRADGYIALAKVEEEQGSNRYLRSAQNLYYQASEIYSKYQTNYKNSYSNYENVKHKADLNDAEDNYKKGIEEYRNAGSSKGKYRAANYYFREAQKYVSNYKDTTKLINETKEKGYFKYNLTSNNSDISRKINDEMSSIGYSVNNGIEVFIEYKNDEFIYNTSSNTNTEQLRKEVQTGTDSNGKAIIKVYNFTKTTTTIEEVGKIRYFLSMRGTYYNNNINNDVIFRNTVKNIKYTGDIPPSSDYRDSEGKTLGSYEVEKKTIEKLRKEVNYNIDSMVSDLKRI
ncbi:MarR family transcriptional regulator [Fusobacterium sp. 1001295B_180824_G3]|uniref:MarR family transcriptional regulator n=1 Tax=Fusobacterium sp. 1001295B_180824_G3 TaxID=2787123 RepID=UPI00189C1192|nr:MarR family transcriptional regulator [Fusobacterium sp. 1001295B_180824_G3]